MSLSRYQLERADLTVTIEQGRRVETELYAEGMRAAASSELIRELGLIELLKARMFGATEYALSLRKRMTKFGSWPQAHDFTIQPEHYWAEHVQGGGDSGQRDSATPRRNSEALPRGPLRPHHPEPHKFPCEDPYCDRCNEAIKRLFRDVGLLPSGKPRPGLMDYTVEPVVGRLKVPSRYRRDESDK